MNKLYENILEDVFLGLSPFSIYRVIDNDPELVIIFKVMDDKSTEEEEDSFTFYKCRNSGRTNGYDWHIVTGATRMVVVIDNYDKVLKFDLDGEIDITDLLDEYGELTDEELLGGLDKGEILADELSGGYTQKEQELYEKLPLTLKELFIESKKIGNFGIVEIYEQMRIEHTYCDGITCTSTQNSSNTDNLNKACRCTGISIDFLNDVAEMYGDDTLAALSELDSEDFFDDIHDNNIGIYIKNQMYYPIIIDYAGYWT